MQRIDPRKQVRFDKNPRVGLHYCVELSADEEKPQVGELCFLDTTSAGGWTHPKLLTLNGVNAALCNVADARGATSRPSRNQSTPRPAFARRRL